MKIFLWLWLLMVFVVVIFLLEIFLGSKNYIDYIIYEEEGVQYKFYEDEINEILANNQKVDELIIFFLANFSGSEQFILEKFISKEKTSSYIKCVKRVWKNEVQPFFKKREKERLLKLFMTLRQISLKKIKKTIWLFMDI